MDIDLVYIESHIIWYFIMWYSKSEAKLLNMSILNIVSFLLFSLHWSFW